jgi:hypothetical protein
MALAIVGSAPSSSSSCTTASDRSPLALTPPLPPGARPEAAGLAGLLTRLPPPIEALLCIALKLVLRRCSNAGSAMRATCWATARQVACSCTRPATSQYHKQPRQLSGTLTGGSYDSNAAHRAIPATQPTCICNGCPPPGLPPPHCPCPLIRGPPPPLHACTTQAGHPMRHGCPRDPSSRCMAVTQHRGLDCRSQAGLGPNQGW